MKGRKKLTISKENFDLLKTNKRIINAKKTLNKQTQYMMDILSFGEFSMFSYIKKKNQAVSCLDE